MQGERLLKFEIRPMALAIKDFRCAEVLVDISYSISNTSSVWIANVSQLRRRRFRANIENFFIEKLVKIIQSMNTTTTLAARGKMENNFSRQFIANLFSLGCFTRRTLKYSHTQSMENSAVPDSFRIVDSWFLHIYSSWILKASHFFLSSQMNRSEAIVICLPRAKTRRKHKYIYIYMKLTHPTIALACCFV